MDIKEEVKSLIKNSLKNFDIEDIKITHPDFLEYGDFTFNVLPLAKKGGGNPREFAEQIRAHIEENLPENIERIDVVGAGFLNFFLSKKFYKKNLEELSVENKHRVGKNILLEHSSPNLFKPFHIGHLVNNSIGESIGRILQYGGNTIETVFFPSDVSPGIAKTIWGLKKKKISVDNLILEDIADAYVFGSEKYEDNLEVKKEVDIINNNIYKYKNSKWKGKKIDYSTEDTDSIIYNKGIELSEKSFKQILKKLGTYIAGDSSFIYESETEKIGKEIIKKNIKNGIFKNSERAVIFEGKNFTNVFINSQGFGTYLAKDIGLLKKKYSVFGEWDKSLVITDIEQKQHFEMVKEAGERIEEISEFTKKSEYLQHGRMNFAGNQKISSRYGNVPLAIDVIEVVKRNILEKMKDRDFSESDKEEISEKLAIATLKYSILKVSSGKNISFDMEKDLNPQGNTATFLEYSYVRALSILEKVSNKKEDIGERKENISDLEKIIYRFKENIEKSTKSYSPHHIANFLYDLAKEFNSFYANTKILDETNLDYNYNLLLVKRFSEIMKKGLELLGIEAVDKM